MSFLPRLARTSSTSSSSLSASWGSSKQGHERYGFAPPLLDLYGVGARCGFLDLGDVLGAAAAPFDRRMRVELRLALALPVVKSRGPQPEVARDAIFLGARCCPLGGERCGGSPLEEPRREREIMLERQRGLKIRYQLRSFTNQPSSSEFLAALEA